MRVITRKLYGRIKLVKFINKLVKFSFSAMPNHENVVNVPPSQICIYIYIIYITAEFHKI